MEVPNPWLELPVSGDCYVLNVDRSAINAYNEYQSGATRIITESIPEPFIGNPNSARILFLNLNPGHTEGDRTDHMNSEFRNAIFANIRHESQEFPFYPLNPRFSLTGAGKWWRKHTRRLQEATGLDDFTLANRLIVIEWFPYHSVGSALPTEQVCESQQYSFQLAKQILRKGLQVVLMRAKKQWAAVDQCLENEPTLRGRRAWISKGNMEGDLFDRVVAALKEE